MPKKKMGEYNESLRGISSYFRVVAFVELRKLCSQDISSEHPERFFVAEIIREKIFMQYRNEVPYACQVKELYSMSPD